MYLQHLLFAYNSSTTMSSFLPLKETCDCVSFLRQNGIERISIELASIEKKEMEWSNAELFIIIIFYRLNGYK